MRFTEDYSQFQSADTVVLPISVDSVPTLKEFKAKEKIGVDLLSDFKREVSRKYGTLLEEKFFSNRAYVIIDRQGIVRWTFAEETTGTRRENAELWRSSRSWGRTVNGERENWRQRVVIPSGAKRPRDPLNSGCATRRDPSLRSG